MPDAWLCASCERPNPVAVDTCRYCRLRAGETPTGAETLVHSFKVQYTEGAFERLDVWTQFEADAEVHARAGYVPTAKHYHEGGGPRPLMSRWQRPFGYRPFGWGPGWHFLRWLARSEPAVTLTVEYTHEDELADERADGPSTKTGANHAAGRAARDHRSDASAHAERSDRRSLAIVLGLMPWLIYGWLHASLVNRVVSDPFQPSPSMAGMGILFLGVLIGIVALPLATSLTYWLTLRSTPWSGPTWWLLLLGLGALGWVCSFVVVYD